MENFSVTIIARNEAKTISRLLKSIAGADEILVLDTGSTDGTSDIVRSMGATVIEVGERFMEVPTQGDIDIFVERYGFVPTFTTESHLFNYAAARNHSMSLAKNDWCFCPDCDEEVIWDLDELHRLLPTCDQLSYRFAFAHNPDGSPGLEFTHCKFLRKSKGHWVKKIHEVIYREPGSVMVDTNALRLEHWQDHQSINRKDFLQKLEYAILEQENDDRNTYYLAREYYYHGMWDTAITMFRKALDLSVWKPERGQAFIYMGDCYKNSGRGDEAIRCYHDALIEDDSRREPFYALGMTYYEWAQYRQAAIYLRAGLEVPFNENYYLNNMNLYSWVIWDALSLVYNKLGETVKAREAWLEAVRAAPDDNRILQNSKWFNRKGIA